MRRTSQDMAGAYRYASFMGLLFVQAFVLFICLRGNPPFSHSHSSNSSSGSGSGRSSISGTFKVGIPSAGPTARAAEVTASEETAGEKSRELTRAPEQQSTEELGYDGNSFFTVGRGIASSFLRAGTATDSTVDGFIDGSRVNGELKDSYSGAAGYSLKEGDAGQKKMGVREEDGREEGEQEEEEERPPIRRRLRKHEPDDDVDTLLRGAQNDQQQHNDTTSSPRRPMPSNQTNSNNDTTRYHEGTATADSGEKLPTGGSSAVAAVGGGTQEEAGMVRFRLEGRVESFMAGNAMREYLNLLVDESVAATKNQVTRRCK